MSDPLPQQRPVSALAAVLSYLVPGLGQLYQGRVVKGLLFMVCLLSLFFLGQMMGDWKNVYIPEGENQQWGDRFAEQNIQFRLQRLQQLPNNLYQRLHFLGQFWIGASAWPALWQYFALPVPNKEAHPFWHDLERAPSENAINRYWVKSDKTPDLGWIYTVIAGVLNILVIYDAYAGPAFPGDLREDTKKKEGKPQEAHA